MYYQPYRFLVNDTTVPENNTSRFRKNLIETLDKKIMDVNI